MSKNRWQRRKQQTRAALLAAGIQLIMERGYDAVTVADIARAADYGRSTFYLHFQDKEDLVWVLLTEFMDTFDQQILDAITPLASPQREWVAWKMIFGQIELQRQFYLQLDGELSRRLRQQQKVYLIEQFEAHLRSGVYSLLLSIPPAVGARFVVGALLELLDYWLDHPEQGDAETMAGYMFQLVFRQAPPVNS